jgi:alcohol dehydrogenase, propanol-preferring
MQIPQLMQAMVLEAPGQPLQLKVLPLPTPAPRQVLLRVQTCGICRTDLHVVDGEFTHAKLPLIPGHQIVGQVIDRFYCTINTEQGAWCIT